eukprot:Rhum_TRINITY_DN14632_c6_g1::Rhum_TRINITY_DN14632_c6_g1_i1::g.106390::m.106390
MKQPRCNRGAEHSHPVGRLALNHAVLAEATDHAVRAPAPLLIVPLALSLLLRLLLLRREPHGRPDARVRQHRVPDPRLVLHVHLPGRRLQGGLRQHPHRRALLRTLLAHRHACAEPLQLPLQHRVHERTHLRASAAAGGRRPLQEALQRLNGLVLFRLQPGRVRHHAEQRDPQPLPARLRHAERGRCRLVQHGVDARRLHLHVGASAGQDHVGQAEGNSVQVPLLGILREQERGGRHGSGGGGRVGVGVSGRPHRRRGDAGHLLRPQLVDDGEVGRGGLDNAGRDAVVVAQHAHGHQRVELGDALREDVLERTRGRRHGRRRVHDVLHLLVQQVRGAQAGQVARPRQQQAGQPARQGRRLGERLHRVDDARQLVRLRAPLAAPLHRRLAREVLQRRVVQHDADPALTRRVLLREGRCVEGVALAVLRLVEPAELDARDDPQVQARQVAHGEARRLAVVVPHHPQRPAPQAHHRAELPHAHACVAAEALACAVARGRLDDSQRAVGTLPARHEGRDLAAADEERRVLPGGRGGKASGCRKRRGDVPRARRCAPHAAPQRGHRISRLRNEVQIL